MSLKMLDHLKVNFRKFPERNAFCISDQYFTYQHFEKEIRRIRQLISIQVEPDHKYVGLLTFDDLQTYASIYALWFLGKAYVALNPSNPVARNLEIVRQMGISSFLSSDGNHPAVAALQSFLTVIDTESAKKDKIEIASVNAGLLSDQDADPKQDSLVDPEADCYVLFTSGSTGKPKGVPISRKNLDTFVTSFIDAGYQFSEEDRFLQIYDLSFDASVHCFTVPLTVGGCVYTVPRDQIKYLYAYKLMKDKQLTFVKMPPSTLSYLQPYFASIHLPYLRYCLMGGEAFPAKLAEQWSPCVPNAQIQNVYGPTEFTINSHIFNWDTANSKKKSNHGIVSIGKCFGDSVAIVVNEKLQPLADHEKGELCLSGNQQTRGYWKDEPQTDKAFFILEEDGTKRRYYRTGDLVYRDSDGDYMFVGRLDSQVQVDGFRVELGEIEKHAIDFLEGSNLVAFANVNARNVTELFFFVESTSCKVESISDYLGKNLPAYMVPKKIITIRTFPKTAGGKINRTALKKYLDNE